MRGPLVYCLESVDVPDGIRFEDICLPANAKWKVQYKPDLLGGVNVLKTKAQVLEKTIEEDIGGYQQVKDVEPRRIDITMIPYYAWNNRDRLAACQVVLIVYNPGKKKINNRVHLS